MTGTLTSRFQARPASTLIGAGIEGMGVARPVGEPLRGRSGRRAATRCGPTTPPAATEALGRAARSSLASAHAWTANRRPRTRPSPQPRP